MEWIHLKAVLGMIMILGTHVQRVAGAKPELDDLLQELGPPEAEENLPELCTEADIRTVTGNEHEPLCPAERIALAFTNAKIMNGDRTANLEQNHVDAQMFQGYTKLSSLQKRALQDTCETILSGTGSLSYEQTYKTLVRWYCSHEAHDDAEVLYKSMKGLGTDTQTVITILRQRVAKPEMDCLKTAFANYLRIHEESGTLVSWLEEELSGGWLDIALDACLHNLFKEDTEYFLSSAVAKWWKGILESSDRGAKFAIKKGNLMKQAIGLFNQIVFRSAEAANEAIGTSVNYWQKKIAGRGGRLVHTAAAAGLIMATFAGAFGTKALDSTLAYQDIEDGLVDVIFLFGTWGGLKLVTSGVHALSTLPVIVKASRRMTYALYTLKNALHCESIAPHYFANLAKICRKAKIHAKSESQAARYAVAADKLDEAEQAARDALTTYVQARLDVSLARSSINKANAATVDAMKGGVAATVRAQEALVKLRMIRKVALMAFRKASRGRSTAAVAAILHKLTSPVLQNVKIASKVSRKLDPKIGNEVTLSLKKILFNLKVQPDTRLVGKTFNSLLESLKEFAKKNGITISHRTESVGVYSNGLYEIELAGFGEMGGSSTLVSFAYRHELAHIFHTLQVRATLIRSVQAQLITEQEARAFLNVIEGGANYRQFEKAVTGISGAAHCSARSQHADLYVERVVKLLDGTRSGLHAGLIHFPTGKTVEEVYALFLSKLPLLVGKSVKEASLRFPFLSFVVLYVSGVRATRYGLDVWGVGLRSTATFAEYVNALVVQGYHPKKRKFRV